MCSLVCLLKKCNREPLLSDYIKDYAYHINSTVSQPQASLNWHIIWILWTTCVKKMLVSYIHEQQRMWHHLSISKTLFIFAFNISNFIKHCLKTEYQPQLKILLCPKSLTYVQLLKIKSNRQLLQVACLVSTVLVNDVKPIQYMPYSSSYFTLSTTFLFIWNLAPVFRIHLVWVS